MNSIRKNKPRGESSNSSASTLTTNTLFPSNNNQSSNENMKKEAKKVLASKKFMNSDRFVDVEVLGNRIENPTHLHLSISAAVLKNEDLLRDPFGVKPVPKGVSLTTYEYDDGIESLDIAEDINPDMRDEIHDWLLSLGAPPASESMRNRAASKGGKRKPKRKASVLRRSRRRSTVRKHKPTRKHGRRA